jgi:hypothetical protein
MFVLALTTDFWTAFGSVATGVAAALAAGSLLLSWWQARAAEAAAIRERLRAFTDPVRRIATLLGEGAAVIDAAWRTAAFLREQAGPGTTADDVVRVVREDGVALTASVEGWAAATAADELREALAELAGVEQGLSGELSLFSGAAELLRRIIGNTYSPVMFHQLLDEEALAIFVGRTITGDVDELTRALAGHLYGSTLTYYRFRYDGVPRASSRSSRPRRAPSPISTRARS